MASSEQRSGGPTGLLLPMAASFPLGVGHSPQAPPQRPPRSPPTVPDPDALAHPAESGTLPSAPASSGLQAAEHAAAVASEAVRPAASALAALEDSEEGGIVLPELARLGADSFCIEVIRNMRSAGRMLLSSPVVFPAFQQVSVVLCSLTDPGKLIILDCADKERSAGKRREFAEELVRQWPLSGGARQPLAARAVAPRRRLLAVRRRVAASRAGSDVNDSPVSDDEEQPGGELSAGADGKVAKVQGAAVVAAARGSGKRDQRRSRNGDGDVDVAEGGGSSAGSRASDVNGGGDADGAPLGFLGTKGLDAVMCSQSLALSLRNSGRSVSDPQRKKEVITSAMVQRFQRVTGLPDLDELPFVVSLKLWEAAAELNEEMGAMTGHTRDWKQLYPPQLFQHNWALEWATPQTGAVADRTCLHPPRHPRVKCSPPSRLLGLIVAVSLSPFWNLVVQLYFADYPFDPTAAGKGSQGKREAAGKGGPVRFPRRKAGLDGAQDGAAAAAERGGSVPDEASGSDDEGGGDGADGQHNPSDAHGAPHAGGSAGETFSQGGTQAGADAAASPSARKPAGPGKVSAMEVLKLGRRAIPPLEPGDKGGGSPLKVRKIAGAAESSAAATTPPHPAGLTPLIGRAMLSPKVTGAPLKRPVAAADPPTPARACRTASPSDQLVIRNAVKVARLSATSALLKSWKIFPSIVPDDTIIVRVASVREWAKAVQEQGIPSFLLSPEALGQANRLRHEIDKTPKTANVPKVDRTVVEVVVNGTPRRLPFEMVADMIELHRCNADYKTAGQSSLWLETLGKADVQLDAMVNPFLMPKRLSVVQMTSVLRRAVGRLRLGDKLWARSVLPMNNSQTGEPVDLQTSWTLDVRTFVDAARPVWLKCSFADPFLVELAHHVAEVGMGVHIMTCEKFSAMLRTPQDKTVELAEAIRLGRRWARAAIKSSRVLTMVNHGNSHWCAAEVSLAERHIVWYDPLAPAALDAVTEFSLSRLRLLGNCVLSAQLGTDIGAGVSWSTHVLKTPRQEDSVSCGLFSLQFLVRRVTGGAFQLSGGQADLLRLVLLHKMVVAGSEALVRQNSSA